MKTFPLFPVCLLPLFLAPTVWSAPLPEEGNWGFENAAQGQAVGWRQSPEYPYDRIESTGDAREGGNAAVTLIFENSDTAAQAHYYAETSVPVEPGTGITVAVWAKGLGRLALLAYVYLNADGQEKFLQSLPFRPEEGAEGGSVEVSSEWSQHVFTLPAASLPREPINLRIVLAAAGTVTVDDVTMEDR